MIISYRKCFLFLHIYKVAGSSIRRTLLPFANKKLVAGQTLNYFLKALGLGAMTNPLYDYHPKLKDVRDVIGVEQFSRLYKFSFVRNPWDWQVSLYHYAKQSPRHPQHTLTNSFGGFEDYIEWRVNNELKLQTDYLCDENGKPLIDYLGRFENLDDDFRQVCRHLDIPFKLHFINKSDRRAYQDYYDVRTRKMVQDAFAPDIKMFGYSF